MHVYNKAPKKHIVSKAESSKCVCSKKKKHEKILKQKLKKYKITRKQD